MAQKAYGGREEEREGGSEAVASDDLIRDVVIEHHLQSPVPVRVVGESDHEISCGEVPVVLNAKGVNRTKIHGEGLLLVVIVMKLCELSCVIEPFSSGGGYFGVEAKRL